MDVTKTIAEINTNDYIGISENRLHHILAVARECYEIAKSEGYEEDFCRRMFMIGWNHDIGYEFSKKQEDHPVISEELLNALGFSKVPKYKRVCHAIRKHGQPSDFKTAEWRILNIADLTIDSKGNKVGVIQRLEDIKNRYGENSNQYLTAKEIAALVELIP